MRFENIKYDIAKKKAYELGFRYESQYTGCAQAVIAAVYGALDLPVNDEVFKAGTGLAGGLGDTTNGSCGALVGAAMVISDLFPRAYSNFRDPEGKRWKTWLLVRHLVDRFLKEYGSSLCKDIQKKIFGRSYNLWNKKDHDDFEKTGGHIDKCPNVVGKTAVWAIDIILNANKIIGEF